MMRPGRVDYNQLPLWPKPKPPTDPVLKKVEKKNTKSGSYGGNK